MKVYISADMEGVAGIVDFDQCVPGPRYEHAVDLLTSEVNAAIEGAIEAGASEFVVNDAHYRMSNLRPESLGGRARYVSGRLKPMYMMEGLDESFDAVFLLGYHGSMGADRAVLSHTYSTSAISEVRIDGVVAGEAAINSLVADAFQTPVALVTGDRTTAAETRPFCPDAEYAIVKESITRQSAESLHPLASRELIRERARAGLARASALVRRAKDRTTTLSVRFTDADCSTLAARISGVERTGPLDVAITASALETYRTFVTVLYLCRGMT